MTDWQPISTAPKNGSDIILHCKMDSKYGDALNSTMVGHWREGQFVCMTSIYVGDFGHTSFVKMPWTHWMPLPGPPEGK